MSRSNVIDFLSMTGHGLSTAEGFRFRQDAVVEKVMLDLYSACALCGAAFNPGIIEKARKKHRDAMRGRGF